MASTPTTPTPAQPGGAAATAGARRGGIVSPSEMQLSDDAKKNMMRAKMVSASLGAIVSILMRSAEHKQHTLADLEWMIGPAIARQQFAIVESAQGSSGLVVPIATTLWALVSPGVDQRLSSDLERPVRLTPAEWTSGDIPWIIVAAGDGPALTSLLQKVTETRFAASPPKIRVRGRDGKIAVGRLELKPRQPGPAAST